MFNRLRAVITGLAGPPSNWDRKSNARDFSIDCLRCHYTVLLRNSTGTVENVNSLVESIRAIAEIVIWGDQHDSSIFDFFLEKQVLSQMLVLIQQRNADAAICLQVLQSLHIMIENLRNNNATLYILSNNYVNTVMNNEFVFDNEELLSSYVALLKVISFKLDTTTLHLLYDQKFHDFPLYNQAIRFISYPDRMIRISVRTIILNIFAAAGRTLTSLVSESTLSLHTYELIQQIIAELIEMDQLITSTPLTAHVRRTLSDHLNDYIDMLQYFCDIFDIPCDSLHWLLSENLHTCLLKWTLLQSICTLKRENTGMRLSRGLSSYLLSLYLTFVHNDISLQSFADAICYVPPSSAQSTGNALCEAIIHSENFTDDDKSSERKPINPSTYIFHALDCKLGDHLVLQTLSLINALKPSHSVLFQWQKQVVIELCRILLYSCVPGSRVRPISTVFAAWTLIRNMEYAVPCAQAREIISQCEKLSKLALRRYLHSNSSLNLMELFESERAIVETLLSSQCPVKLDGIAVIVNPTCVAGSSTTKFADRLPCGHIEHLRRSVLVFHVIHTVCLQFNGLSDDYQLAKRTILATGDVYKIASQTTAVACSIVNVGRSSQEGFVALDGFNITLVRPHPSIVDHALVERDFNVEDVSLEVDKRSGSVLRFRRQRDRTDGSKARVGSSNACDATVRFDDDAGLTTISNWVKESRKTLETHKLERLTDLLSNHVMFSDKD